MNWWNCSEDVVHNHQEADIMKISPSQPKVSPKCTKHHFYMERGVYLPREKVFFHELKSSWDAEDPKSTIAMDNLPFFVDVPIMEPPFRSDVQVL